jgi:hypothetical protein
MPSRISGTLVDTLKQAGAQSGVNRKRCIRHRRRNGVHFLRNELL